MPYFVYVIKSSKDERLYKGMTKNLQERIRQHNRGNTKSTRAYRPWTLVHKEEYPSRAEARKRELYLKSGIGREFLKELLKD